MKNVALITGASSGIGKELAIIHAEHGGDLIITARREKELTKLQKELESKYKIKVKIIVKDLSLENAAKEIYSEVKQENIIIDYLINNAGFGGQGRFTQRDWEKDRSMIQVNIVSPSELCHLFLPDFLKENKGKILNVSSTASFLPGPLQAVYFATKAYMQSFSNALSGEVSETNVTVTNLMPGATATEFANAANLDETDLFEKAFSARSVAEDGYKGMLEGKIDVLSGLTFGQKIMLNTLPFIPKKTMLKQVKEMQEIKK